MNKKLLQIMYDECAGHLESMDASQDGYEDDEVQECIDKIKHEMLKKGARYRAAALNEASAVLVHGG